MSKIKFSIIIPVYNTEKYLIRCLKSVFEQKYKEYEVIIVNDGSTDASEKIILNFQKVYKNMKYIKQKNKGLSVARNKGLEQAEGEYIIWLDSDDALVDNILNSLHELTLKKVDVIINRISSYNESNNQISECTYKFNTEEICNRKYVQQYLCRLRGFWYAAWCFIPKREFLIENGIKFMSGIYHEDELWSPIVLCKANSFLFNNKPYYINTSMRQGSIISTNNIKKEFDLLLIAEKLKSIIEEDKNNKKFLEYRILILLYVVYKRIKQYNSKNEKIIELRNQFKKVILDIYGKRSYIIRIVYKIRTFI